MFFLPLFAPLLNLSSCCQRQISKTLKNIHRLPLSCLPDLWRHLPPPPPSPPPAAACTSTWLVGTTSEYRSCRRNQNCLFVCLYYITSSKSPSLLKLVAMPLLSFPLYSGPPFCISSPFPPSLYGLSLSPSYTHTFFYTKSLVGKLGLTLIDFPRHSDPPKKWCHYHQL